MTFSAGSIARQVATGLFGLAIAGASGFFLYLEMSNPPTRPMLVYLFAGGIFLGALIIAPALIMSRVKQIIVLLPDVRIGGNRYSDPKKPEKEDDV